MKPEQFEARPAVDAAGTACVHIFFEGTAVAMMYGTVERARELIQNGEMIKIIHATGGIQQYLDMANSNPNWKG